MANGYYTPTGAPSTGAFAASAVMRSEFDDIAAGFDLLPTLSAGLASRAVVLASNGLSLTTTTGTLALAGNFATTGGGNLSLTVGANVTVILPTVSGLTLATLTGVETLSNKTLVAPALGTPASGVLTNCSGLPAASITGTLAVANGGTGVTTSTGTGSVVLSASPTLTGTPVLSAATATSLAVNGSLIASTTSPLQLNGDITFQQGGASALWGNLYFSGSTKYAANGAGWLLRYDGVTTLAISGAPTNSSGAGAAATTTELMSFGLAANTITSNVAHTFSAAITYGGVTLTNAVTGTGKMVLDTSATLTTPTLGVATATSLNKVTITAPATSATLTIANGKTLTASNSITLAGTDSTTMTFPSTSQSIPGIGITNTFTAAQEVNTNTAAIPAAVSGFMLTMMRVDGASAHIGLISAAAASGLNMYRTDGTIASPSALATSDLVAEIKGRGYDGSSWSGSQAGLQLTATENWDGSHHGMATLLMATPNASTTQAETARADGVGFKVASSKQLWLGNAYSAGAPSATGSVLIYDSSGTALRVLVANP